MKTLCLIKTAAGTEFRNHIVMGDFGYYKSPEARKWYVTHIKSGKWVYWSFDEDVVDKICGVLADVKTDKLWPGCSFQSGLAPKKFERAVKKKIKQSIKQIEAARGPVGMQLWGDQMGKSDYFSEVVFEGLFNALQTDIHQNAIDHGFYPPEITNLTILDKAAEELEECYEAVRTGDDDALLKEAADVCIVFINLAEHKGWNLAMAILDKNKFNRTRPFLHIG